MHMDAQVYTRTAKDTQTSMHRVSGLMHRCARDGTDIQTLLRNHADRQTRIHTAGRSPGHRQRDAGPAAQRWEQQTRGDTHPGALGSTGARGRCALTQGSAGGTPGSETPRNETPGSRTPVVRAGDILFPVPGQRVPPSTPRGQPQVPQPCAMARRGELPPHSPSPGPSLPLHTGTDSALLQPAPGLGTAPAR